MAFWLPPPMYWPRWPSKILYFSLQPLSTWLDYPPLSSSPFVRSFTQDSISWRQQLYLYSSTPPCSQTIVFSSSLLLIPPSSAKHFTGAPISKGFSALNSTHFLILEVFDISLLSFRLDRFLISSIVYPYDNPHISLTNDCNLFHYTQDFTLCQ